MDFKSCAIDTLGTFQRLWDPDYEFLDEVLQLKIPPRLDEYHEHVTENRPAYMKVWADLMMDWTGDDTEPRHLQEKKMHLWNSIILKRMGLEHSDTFPQEAYLEHQSLIDIWQEICRHVVVWPIFARQLEMCENCQWNQAGNLVIPDVNPIHYGMTEKVNITKLLGEMFRAQPGSAGSHECSGGRTAVTKIMRRVWKPMPPCLVICTMDIPLEKPFTPRKVQTTFDWEDADGATTMEYRWLGSICIGASNPAEEKPDHYRLYWAHPHSNKVYLYDPLHAGEEGSRIRIVDAQDDPNNRIPAEWAVGSSLIVLERLPEKDEVFRSQYMELNHLITEKVRENLRGR
jgi:hypothetical protein